MSWASDRLSYLSQHYTYSQIRENTGIPASTISYVIREQRVLPSKYILNLRSFYTRAVYRQLRDAGLPVSMARQIRWKSPSIVTDYLNQANAVIAKLVEYRLPTQIAYMQRIGTYVSDQHTRELLTNWISQSISRTPLDINRAELNQSPSLRHVIFDPEE